MKKLSKFVLAATILMMAAQVNAQIDNLSNMSPEWVRSGSRNAATDGTDGVVYNPAGLTKLTTGFHLAIGNQSLFRKPTHEYDLGYGTTKFEQDGNDMFVPNLFMSYNKSNWALWGGMYISGGGAVANYPHGSINTDLISMMALGGAQGAYANVKDQYLKASSYYLTTTAGFSVAATNMVSFSVGVRYLNAKNKTEAGTTLTESPYDLEDMPLALDSKDNASGFSGVIGINATPTEKLNIGVRYETQAKLDFTTAVTTDDIGLMVNGDKHRRDLPGMLGIGMGYNVTEKFRASAEMNYYFQTAADWGTMADDTKLSTIAGNAVNYAACFEYKVSPKLLWSLGTMYTVLNWENRDLYYTTIGAFETVPGNNVTVNTGCAYALTGKTKLNLGIAKTFYEKDRQINVLNAAPYEVTATVNNSVMFLSAGLDFQF